MNVNTGLGAFSFSPRAVSKVYYAIFQAAKATLELDSRKHSGVISMFNINFIKTGILPKEYRKIIVLPPDKISYTACSCRLAYARKLF